MRTRPSLGHQIGERSSHSGHVGFGGSEAEVLSEAEAAVLAAIALVNDPEYPGVSIVDLGLLEHVEVRNGIAGIGIIPTFSGCPALEMIRSEVELAVRAVPGIESVSVSWLTSPAWTADRVSKRGREALASEFTVAVQIGDRAPTCPLCGAPTAEKSMFGPSRCRSIHRCDSCSETVEVMRG